jgi:hypothetical protein
LGLPTIDSNFSRKHIAMKNNLLQSTKAGVLALAAAALLVPGAALEAQIFVTNSDSISEYTTSGVLVDAKLVKGLDGAEGIAISGGDLFVVNEKNGTIGEYTTSGAPVVSGFGITPGGAGIAVSGSYVYAISYVPLLNVDQTNWGGSILVYLTNGAGALSVAPSSYSLNGIAVDSGGICL